MGLHPESGFRKRGAVHLACGERRLRGQTENRRVNVMFGVLGVPLFREHTSAVDGYCDFRLKLVAEPMPYDPPVFSRGKGFR